MEPVTFCSLPPEILERIIDPFGTKPTDQMVCKGWVDISQRLIAKAFQRHKSQLRTSLDEILSIDYKIIKLHFDNAVVSGYPCGLSTDGLILTTNASVKRSIWLSVRQYRNKVGCHRLVTELVHGDHLIANKIKITNYTAQTIYYEYIKNLTEYSVPGDIKRLKAIRSGPCYKYNINARDRMGLSYVDTVRVEEAGMIKDLQFNIVAISHANFDNSDYSVYYCPIESPW